MDHIPNSNYVFISIYIVWWVKASIFTDNIQFFFFFILIIVSFFFNIRNVNYFNFNFIKQNKPSLLDADYIINFTAGITFFIAVAATNLFHQGNWQRVYAAKNFATLKRSLILAFLIIIPIVFIFGFSGLVAISLNPNVVPDLAFFSLVLNKNDLIISVTIIFIAISLTVSSIDTIMNAVSSLIIVDTKKIINLKYDSIHTSKYLVSFLAVITFLISSQGISILYLFLIADLFCCAAVFSVFYSFYTKSPNEKNIYLSIVMA